VTIFFLSGLLRTPFSFKVVRNISLVVHCRCSSVRESCNKPKKSSSFAWVKKLVWLVLVDLIT